MKKFKIKVFALIIVVMFLLLQAPAFADMARVISVIDGDTIDVVLEKDGSQKRIRYLLIDTPETKHPARGEEAFGEAAKAANIELVTGKTVRLEYDKETTDAYGRTLAYVWINKQERNEKEGKEFLVSEVLALNGFALKMQIGANRKHEGRIDRAVSIARENKRGLWQGVDKTYPISTLWANAPSLKGKWLAVKLSADNVKKTSNTLWISQEGIPINISFYKSAFGNFPSTIKAGEEIIIYGNLSADKRGWYIRVGDPRQVLKW